MLYLYLLFRDPYPGFETLGKLLMAAKSEEHALDMAKR